MYEHNGNTTLKHAASRFGQSLELLFSGDRRVEEHVEIFAVTSLLPGLDVDRQKDQWKAMLMFIRPTWEHQVRASFSGLSDSLHAITLLEQSLFSFLRFVHHSLALPITAPSEVEYNHFPSFLNFTPHTALYSSLLLSLIHSCFPSQEHQLALRYVLQKPEHLRQAVGCPFATIRRRDGLKCPQGQSCLDQAIDRRRSKSCAGAVEY